MSEGPVYSLDDFRVPGQEAAPGTSGIPSVGPLSLGEQAEPPAEKFAALLAESTFRATWERTRRDTPDKSASGWDWHLATCAVEASWTDQEIANLLIAHRRKHGDDLKLRDDYYTLTIEKARSAHGASNLFALLAEAQSPEERRAATLGYFSQQLGTELIRLVRLVGPPSAYEIETALGTIHLGGVEGLTSLTRFRNTIFDVTGRYLAVSQKQWPGFVQALRDICDDVVIEELTPAGRVRDWIDAYLGERRILPTADQGALKLWPFVQHDNAQAEDRVCLFAADLHRWLGDKRQERISHRELCALLRTHGCVPTTVAVHDRTGKRTSRSVWVLPTNQWPAPAPAVEAEDPPGGDDIHA